MASALLDLSFLTKEERKLLEKVVKADEDLRLRDRIRLGTLRQKYEVSRHHQESVQSSSKCSCCDADLPVLRKRGAPCPSCGHMTCVNCRHKPHGQPFPFICTVCEDKWMLDIQSKKYESEEASRSPQEVCKTSSSSSKSGKLSQSSEGIERSSLYGSDLIKRSLTMKSAKLKAKVSASPEVDDNSSPSPSPTTNKKFEFKHRESESSKSRAKKLSPSEIPSTDSDAEKASLKRDSEGSGKMCFLSRVDADADLSSNYDTTKYKVSSSSEQENKSELSSAKVRKASAPSSQGHASVVAAQPEKLSCMSTEEAELAGMKHSNEGLIGKGRAATKSNVSYLKSLETRNAGKILVEVWHSEERLHVKVIEGCGILSRKDGQLPYSCVIVQLLPDNQCKRSTIQSSTEDPEFNAVFTYNVDPKKVSEKSLLISVMDCVKKITVEDTCLGQIKIDLSKENLSKPVTQWYTLKSKVTGELLMSMDYSKEKLKVLITMARDLKGEERNKICSPRVIGSLAVNGCSNDSIQVTETQQETFNPVFMEEMLFEVKRTDIEKEVLHLSMIDGMDGSFLGEVIVPLSTVNETSGCENWYTLQEKNIGTPSPILAYETSYCGELDLDLMFSPNQTGNTNEGTLKVLIGGLKDYSGRIVLSSKKKYYSVIRLLPNKDIVAKTAIRCGKSSDLYEILVFANVHRNELVNDRVLEITIVSSEGPEETVFGYVCLGPAQTENSKKIEGLNFIVDESTHWTEMLQKPGVMIRNIHKLRPSNETEIPAIVEEARTTTTSVQRETLSLKSSKTRSSLLLAMDSSSMKKGHVAKCDKLLLKLMFKQDPANSDIGNLYVIVQEAKLSNKTSCFVTLSMLNEGHADKKTTQIKNDSNPVWSKSFTFQCYSPSSLKTNACLDVTITDWNNNSTIGHFKLESNMCIATDHQGSKDASIWECILNNESTWFDLWHSLTEPTEITMRKNVSSFEPAKKQPTSSHIDEAAAEAAAKHSNFQSQLPKSHTPVNPFSEDSSISMTASSQCNETHKNAEKLDKQENKPVPLLQPSQQIHGASSEISHYSSKESLYSTLSINGEVMFGVWHKEDKLYIHIARASNLGLSSESSCNPYAKTYLLPDKDKRTKKKTDSKRNTQNPEYDETITYHVKEEELEHQILCVSVWDRGTLKRNHFMGEIQLPLSVIDLEDSTDRWYALGDKVTDTEKKAKLSAGVIELATMFESSTVDNEKGTLHITIKKATKLSTISTSKLKKVSVECCLLPCNDGNKMTTSKFGKGSSPVWEETLSIQNISHQQLLEENVLQITLLERREFLGCIRLGQHPSQSLVHQPWMDATELEALNWDKMLNNPGKWIYACYPLRLSVSPRPVDSLPPPMFDSSMESPTLKQSTAQPPESVELNSEEHSLESLQSTAEQTHKSSLKSSVQSGPEPFSESGNSMSFTPLSPHTPPTPSTPNSSASHFTPKTPSSPSSPITPSAKEITSIVSKLLVQKNSEHSVPNSDVKMSNCSMIEQTGSSSYETPTSPINWPPIKSDIKSLQDTMSTTTGEMISANACASSENESIKHMSDFPAIETSLTYVSGTVTNLELESKDKSQANLKDTKAISTTISPPSGRSQEEKSLMDSNILGSSDRGSLASFGSLASVYSAAGGKGNYDIIGEVLFGVYYKEDHLVIHVNKARGIAAANKNGLSDPYVKTYLLPDKHKQTKKKTGIKRKTLNPVFDEIIKYSVKKKELLNTCTLWLSVWDWDRFGRNQFLGEVRIPLSTIDLKDTTDHWHSLVEGNDEQSAIYRGEVTLSLKVDSQKSKKGKTKWTLHVRVARATDLYHGDSKPKADSFVKCFLLPDKSSSGKRKTGVIKNNNNPVWDEVHCFEKLTLDELTSRRVLEVTVWNYSKSSSSEFIGGLRLGPGPAAVPSHEEWMDSIGEEAKHWDEAVAKTGEWVEHSHTLRPTMDYRNVQF